MYLAVIAVKAGETLAAIKLGTIDGGKAHSTVLACVGHARRQLAMCARVPIEAVAAVLGNLPEEKGLK